jgi:hypothetical protein
LAKDTNSLILAATPAASGVHLIDSRLVGRVFYRDDRNPACSIWQSADDPLARGDLVILRA